MKRSTAVALCTWFQVAACISSGSRPPALVDAEKRVDDTQTLERARQAAPHRVESMLTYFALAMEAFEAGHRATSAHYATLANLNQDVALEMARLQAAQQRQSSALSRIASANRAADNHEEQGRELSEDIALLEKIITLEQALADLPQQNTKSQRDLQKQLAAVHAKRQERVAQAHATHAARQRLAEVQRLVHAANAWKNLGVSGSEATRAQQALFAAEQMAAQRLYVKAARQARLAERAAQKALDKAKRTFAVGATDSSPSKNSSREQFVELGTKYKLQLHTKDSRGVAIVLHDLFTPGQAELRHDALPVFAAIAQLSQVFADWPILIEGHTDSHGTHQDNLRLASTRAEAVLDHLVLEQSVNVRRLQATGYGELNPIATNDTPEGRAQNRRVEVLFLIPEAAPEQLQAQPATR